MNAFPARSRGASILAFLVLLAGCKPAPAPPAKILPTPTVAAAPIVPAPTAVPLPPSEPARPAATPEISRAELQREVDAAEKRLLAAYQSLDARRKALAGKSGPELDAYNREAAAYQSERAALGQRQTRLRALITAEQQAEQVAGERDVPAKQLLSRLRSAVGARDVVAQMRALSEAQALRDRPSFPAINALAVELFARVTFADFARPAATAPTPPPTDRAEEAAAVTEQIRAIVDRLPERILASGVSKGAVAWQVREPGKRLDWKAVTAEDITTNQEMRWRTRLVSVDLDNANTEYYRGDDTEYNLATAFFYTDLKRPKKHLTPEDITKLIPLYQRLGALESEQRTVAAPRPLQQNPDAGRNWEQWQVLRDSWPR